MKRSITLTILLMTLGADVSAQTQLGGIVGVTSSINIGEIVPAPIFRGTLAVGDKLRFENSFEFNTADKYTGAGWAVENRADILIFPFDCGLFATVGADYRHRNGGPWSKDRVRVGLGGGYENTKNEQYRFSTKTKIFSVNDDIIYSPFFEILVRGDYSLGVSNWSLRVETKVGAFRYIQNENRRMAVYSDVGLGMVYKWP